MQDNQARFRALFRRIQSKRREDLQEGIERIDDDLRFRRLQGRLIEMKELDKALENLFKEVGDGEGTS